MVKKGLGKGLGAIISTSATPVADLENELTGDPNRIVEIDLDLIEPNPDQPRSHFDENEITGLAESIKSVGLIQQIIVRKAGDRYYIVAGERRYRATRLLGKKKIKASVIQTDEQDNVTLALIENIQRSNLDPIEEAKAYRVLLNRFKLKQNDIALKVGKDRATITNSLRLLNLPEDIQEGLSRGLISVGHAKVLLSLTDKDRQRAMFDEIVEKGLSVRSLETAVNEIKTVTGKSKPRGLSKKEAHIKKMEEKLIHVLGTKVEIRHSGSKGRIEIFYYSLDDFDRIVELIK